MEVYEKSLFVLNELFACDYQFALATSTYYSSAPTLPTGLASAPK